MYLGLGKEWVMIIFDNVVFGWAVHVAVFQISPGLMWTTIILFCLYLQSVTVRCDISAGLIRQSDLYGTCYMGLLFDMDVWTSLIFLFQCLTMPYSLQSLCIYGITFRQF